jgi:hypothetical protein
VLQLKKIFIKIRFVSAEEEDDEKKGDQGARYFFTNKYIEDENSTASTLSKLALEDKMQRG